MNQMVAMTGSIAHEIKQPIAAIVASANAGLRWLERTNPDVDETRAVLKAIVRDGHRVDGVINGIRTVFKGNAATRVSVDLNKLIREVLAFAQGEHQTWPIEVHSNLADNLPLVPGDRVQLQQVIFNLITNAIDAMDMVIDRTRSLRVTSELKGSDAVVVKIADTGTGIAPENIDRIFDTFFTTKSHGMGRDSQFAAQLSKLTAERCPRRRGTRMEQSSSPFCRLARRPAFDPGEILPVAGGFGMSAYGPHRDQFFISTWRQLLGRSGPGPGGRVRYLGRK